MRILIATGIFPPDIGGPATYAPVLANHLVSKGHEVTVLTYSRSFRPKDAVQYNFKVIRIWGGWPIWIKHAIFGVKLLYIYKKQDIALALNMWNVGFPVLVASRLLKKEFMIRVVGDYAWEVGVGKGKVNLMLDDFQKSLKKGWIRRLYNLQKRVCNAARTVIVPSNYLAGIVEGWGVSKDKIKVIYNGVEFDSPTLSKEEARKKIGIPGNIIISWGRLVPWKGFKMLIKIMPKLLEINQFFRLVILGDGPELKSLEQMVKNMGLDKKVYVLGRKSKDEVGLYLAASDVFVLNSGYEGFSHQILEAMTAGVPVIASAVGGNTEVIKQGHNGFLVKYNDEFNLIEAINGLHKLPEMREQFILEAKKTVAKFSVEKMLEETEKLLTS